MVQMFHKLDKIYNREVIVAEKIIKNALINLFLLESGTLRVKTLMKSM